MRRIINIFAIIGIVGLFIAATTYGLRIDDQGNVTIGGNIIITGTGTIGGNTIVGADFGGISVNGNAVETTINLVHSWEKVIVFNADMPEAVSNGDNSADNVTIGATGNYDVNFCSSGESAAGNKTFEYSVFEIANSGSTITDATQATPVVITAVSHGFTNNDKVKITSVSGMTDLNIRIFTVTNKGDDTFELEDDNGTDINGAGFGAYTSDGIAFLATETIVHAHRKFSTGGGGDFGAASGCGIVPLTINNTVELWVKDITDATNYTFETVTMKIKREN